MLNRDCQITNNKSVSNTCICYQNVGKRCMHVIWDNILLRCQWSYMALIISRIIGCMKGFDSIDVIYKSISVWLGVLLSIYLGTSGFVCFYLLSWS